MNSKANHGLFGAISKTLKPITESEQMALGDFPSHPTRESEVKEIEGLLDKHHKHTAIAAAHGVLAKHGPAADKAHHLEQQGIHNNVAALHLNSAGHAYNAASHGWNLTHSYEAMQSEAAERAKSL